MGVLINTMRDLLGFLPGVQRVTGTGGSGGASPETKMPDHAVVPIWQTGLPVYPQQSYEAFARHGYTQNEVVFACIEERATSASEPRFVAYTRTSKGKQHYDQHPIMDVLEAPNPFMSRSDLIGETIMHLDVAGNAYWEKVRTGSRKVVELWPLRPDRVRVVPDARTFIAAYQYQLGTDVFTLAPEDVIHFKTRHPLDDFYGMPPLLPIAARVDSDNFMRDFVAAFFNNAGVPAGILTLEQDVTADQRDAIRSRFRSEYGGPQGWHSLLVLTGSQAKYQSMGMSLGQRGLVVPELQDMSEARIAMVFGVPLILIGARLGMEHNTFANYREARASFWDETLIPLYKMISSTIERSMVKGKVPDFVGLDGVEFDLSDVQALREDEDALHARARENAKAAIWTVEEARALTGQTPQPSAGGYYLMPIGVTPTPAGQVTEAFEQAAEAADAAAEAPADEPTVDQGADTLQDATDETAAKALASPGLSRNGHLPVDPGRGYSL